MNNKINTNKISFILIHGFSSSPWEMRLLGNYLESNGYYVSMPLLAGHGSVPEDLRKVKYQDWINQIRNEIKKQKKNSNFIILAGLSMGGALAAYVSTIDKIDGLILIAPGIWLRRKLAFLSHVIKFLYHKNIQKGDPDISVQTEIKSYKQIPLTAVSEMLKLYKKAKLSLKKINIPCLTIYAVNDHVINPKSAVYIHKKISSEKKKLIALHKSFHIVPLDIEKEYVFEQIHIFMKDVLNPD